MSRMTPVATFALLAAITLSGVGCASVSTVQERDNLRVENTELKKQRDDARTAADAFSRDNMALKAENDQLKAQVAQLQNQTPVAPPVASGQGAPQIAGVETLEDSRTVTMRITGDVLFASGKADLKESSKRTLDQVVREIQSRYPGKTVRVAGHTDSDKISRSKWTDNWELSCERALSVLRYLQSQGIEGSQLYAAGFGQYQPRGSKPSSRRVEIIVEKN